MENLPIKMKSVQQRILAEDGVVTVLKTPAARKKLAVGESYILPDGTQTLVENIDLLEWRWCGKKLISIRLRRI